MAIIAVCVMVDLVVETVVASINSARYTVVTLEDMEYSKTTDVCSLKITYNLYVFTSGVVGPYRVMASQSNTLQPHAHHHLNHIG